MELLIIRDSGKGFEAGDIIDVRPDGFEWGAQELSHPMFRIVRVPDSALAGMSRDEVLAPVIDESIPDGNDNVISHFSHRIVGLDLTRKEKSRKGGINESILVRNIPPIDLPSEVNRRVE